MIALLLHNVQNIHNVQNYFNYLTSHVSHIFKLVFSKFVIIICQCRSIFRMCMQLLRARIRQHVGVDGWMSIRRRSKRDGQHRHRWSGRYMKPARRIGARFHRNLRTCRLLPSAMTPSFLFFLLTRPGCAHSRSIFLSADETFKFREASIY